MSGNRFDQLSPDELDYVDDKTAALLLNTPNSARILLWVVVAFFILAAIWASWAEIDKVTVGEGKVVPSSQIQVVQNLEGGLVKEILVKEGQQVEKGQRLLLIDDTRFRSDYREREQQIANLTASVLRLSTSISSVVIREKFDEANWENSVAITINELSFPESFIEKQTTLIERQNAEYRQNLKELINQMSLMSQQVNQKQQDLVEIQARVQNLRESYKFAKKELEITIPLADEGIVPQIELLKLQRQVNDTRRELTSSQLKVPVLKSAIRETILSRIDTAQQFRSKQQEKLNSAQDQLSSLNKSTIGLEDKVNRTVVTS